MRKIKKVGFLLMLLLLAGSVLTSNFDNTQVLAARRTHSKRIIKKKGKKKVKEKKVTKQKSNYFKQTDDLHQNLVPQKEYELKGLYNRVVQKHYLNETDIYALQLLNGNVVIRKANNQSFVVNFPSVSKSMKLTNDQHTQTWEDVGNDEWLVGVSPKSDPYSHFVWTTEIARIRFNSGNYNGNEMPRLTDLDAATDDPNYSVNQLQRVEATVSPDKHYLMINSLQYPNKKGAAQTAHFAIYDLNEINHLLDKAENSDDKTVSLRDVKPLDAFHLTNVYGNKKNGGIIPEFQGLAIDNDKNLYISCQNHPVMKKGKAVTQFPREIIKLPWGSTNPNEWKFAKLNYPEWKNYATEFEGIQLTNNGLYLNVAYHRIRDYVTVRNCIFKVPDM